MPYLRALAFALTMGGAFVFLVPLQALARRRGWPIQHAIQTRFCRAICAVIGVTVEAQGALPSPAPRFVVSNHVSWTDIIALASLYPFVFLAKSQVARWPVLGLLARLQGTIFVERGAKQDVARVNDALADVLRAGHDLVVFPEGTSSDGAQVLPFRSAHFAPLEMMAARGEAPTLAPVAIAYSDGARKIDVGWYGDMTFLPHLWSLMKRGRAQCHISFGEAIETSGKDRKTLAAEMRANVQMLLSSPSGLASPRPHPAAGSPQPEERPQGRVARLANLTSISGKPEIDGGVSMDDDYTENRSAPAPSRHFARWGSKSVWWPIIFHLPCSSR